MYLYFSYLLSKQRIRIAFLQKYKKLKRSKREYAITCSKLTIETLEQGVKYVQS